MINRVSLFTFSLVLSLTISLAQAQTSEIDSLRQAAEQGNFVAQHLLGVAYDNGDGVPKDYIKAANWFRKSAEQGYADAQFMLGYAYYRGEVVLQDRKEAIKWWRQAAEQGHAGAQAKLGSIYRHGEGVPQDHTEAVKWLRKGAEQGDADAQRSLGWAYFEGEGVQQDRKEAVKWWRQAAEQGDADAQASLGWAYFMGKGVPADHAKAHALYSLAASKLKSEPRENVVKFRDKVAEWMAQKERSEAQRLARDANPEKVSRDTGSMEKEIEELKEKIARYELAMKRLRREVQGNVRRARTPSSAPPPAAGVIESKIDGTFEGWEGETVFKLLNGQTWQQSSYAYTYHYSYMPDVLIYKSSGGQYKMKVEGVGKTISVRRLR